MKSQARTCILVAGLHRSGTSATARVVNLLGADIACNLVAAIPGDNDRGFWESHTTYQLHDRLFAALDSAWHDPFPLPEAWRESDAAREAKRAIRTHIESEFRDSGMFVVKDPRITRVLPLWLDVLDEGSIEPVIIIPFRNPLEVAASLERRNGLSLAHSLLVYIQGSLDVELASRGRGRLFQRYDDLISDWRSFAERLANIGGPDGSAVTPAIAGEIDEFLSADLKRQRAGGDRLARAAEGTTAVAIYDAMGQATAAGDDTALRACFDRVRERMLEPTKLFNAAASAQVKHFRDEIAKLEAKTAGEARRREAEIEELRAQLRALEARAGDAARAQATANKEIASMLGSTSWRVTAPLRAIARLVRASRSRRPTVKHGGLRRT